MSSLDRYDIEIVYHLQRDGRLTNADLAERIHLSPSQVNRRWRRLEQIGLIGRTAAILDAAKVGLGVTAFTDVSLEGHSDTRADAFHRAVMDMEEVLDCYSVTGESDYVLKIVTPDLQAFSEFLMHRLMHLPGVRSVHSRVVLTRVKEATALPLGHLRRG